jgi:hypothetical protein
MFQSQSAKNSSAVSGIQLFVVKRQQVARARKRRYVLKQRYEKLALEFAQNAGDERDLDITAPPLTAINPKSDSGNTNPHK